jgi:hypothetical protein
MSSLLNKSCLPILAALLALCCVSCGKGDGSAENKGGKNGGSEGERMNLPALHVVLEWENLLHGKNQSREGYEAWVRTCLDAGMPMKELTADEVAKLGTGRVEILMDAQRQLVRQTAWDLKDGQENQFGVSICNPRVAERAREDAPYGLDQRTPYRPYDKSTEEQLQGAAAVGREYLGTANIQGQECKRWRGTLGFPQDECIWSGGRQWGFSDNWYGTADCLAFANAGLLRSIPLDAAPVGFDTGCVIKLKSFSLSEHGLLPDSLFSAVSSEEKELH